MRFLRKGLLSVSLLGLELISNVEDDSAGQYRVYNSFHPVNFRKRQKQKEMTDGKQDIHITNRLT